MDDHRVTAYLARINATRPSGPTPAALRDLQLSHLMAVPFENLSIHLDEAIVLEETALVDKLVGGRGGFCYELNGAFAALLAALGFQVTMLAARALTAEGIGPPFDHLTLRVDLAEPWLVDVGWGRFRHHPLRLDIDSDQGDPGGTFRIVPGADGDLDVLMDGQAQYRVERRPRVLRDFAATCWWHQTSPRSHFPRSLVCSRLTEAGRVSVSERKLIETIGGDRRQRSLATDAEVLLAYQAHFGIVLDRVPGVRFPPAGDHTGEGG